MELAYMAFSEQGYELAKELASRLGGEATRKGLPDESGKVLSLGEWTEAHFSSCDGIIFVGAAGIAVRAIAPFIKDKTSDPAVVVIDDRALHVIPLLSGHLGGANDLARKISEITGSDCVITTATDINGVFAVDEWSKRQGCTLLDSSKIVGISGRLLHGARVSVYSPWNISGKVPDGINVTDSADDADISLDIRGHDGPLQLVPKVCVLGVGCRRGTAVDTLEGQFEEFLSRSGIEPEAIKAVATIDLKKDEAGLIEFCEKHGWPLLTYSSAQLKEVPGEFSSSEFVSSVTGVDNVCERSAVLASGGDLIVKKASGSGVTMALGMSKYEPNWNWKD